MRIKLYNEYIRESLSEENKKVLMDGNPHLWWLDSDLLDKRSLEVADMLKRDCAPFIKEVSKMRNKDFLYRGTHKSIINFEEREVRKDRRPKNTASHISAFIDSLFMKRFDGKRLRMETVFATSSESDASAYGETYLFFPIGDYKCYWNEQVTDLFADVDSLEYEYSEEEMDEKLEDIVDGYIEGSLEGAIRAQVEVMFDCDKYYLIKTAYEPKLKKILFGED
jgi:hypothetical protein